MRGMMTYMSLIFVCLLLFDNTTLLAEVDVQRMRSAVFKIKVFSQEPDPKRPWEQQRLESSSGTGFFIGKNQILTNAHVVAHGKYIGVLRDGSDKETAARVKYIAHDCDLALLEVQDIAFFSGMNPLSFGDVPNIRDTVYTVGFPIGGDQISVTEGVVSRISYRSYVHSRTRKHLLVQVDSAINPGNSGGPVMHGQELAGVAFQGNNGGENLGYIIPVPIVKRFLQDIEDGRYDGHPTQGLVVQEGALENPALRKNLDVKPTDNGVLVNSLEASSPLFGLLKERDVLLAIDGQNIGLDGKLKLYGERLSFWALYDLKQKKDKVRWNILRNGKRLEVETPLADTSIKPYDDSFTFAERPQFLVYAGLVFRYLNLEFLETIDQRWYSEAPIRLRYLHFWKNRSLDTKKPSSNIIVLSAILPHPLNAGAMEFQSDVLEGLNGESVSSLEELKDKIASSKDKFLSFEFWGNSRPLVLDRAAAAGIHPKIRSAYKIALDHYLDKDVRDGATAKWSEP